MVFVFGSLGYLLLHLVYEIGGFGLFLTILQMPILMILFWSSIKYFRKKKASAAKNKVFSITALIIADIAYIALIMSFIMNFGLSGKDDSNYRTVNWQLSKTESHEFKIYSDDIPLTSEDLYGPINYDYYSYEREMDSTLFISKSVYRQDTLPAKDSPPGIEYEVLKPNFDFVYRLSKQHLLEIPEWRDKVTFEPIDNRTFDTVEAYQRYYEDTPTGEYALFFEDKIIRLDMEEPLTTKQISIIKEKLKI
jgi:hypothetical protein